MAPGDPAAEAAEVETPPEEGGLMAKAKEVLTDERIGGVAEAIEAKSPDSIDGTVEQVADKAKEWND